MADFILEDYNDDKYIYLDYLIKFKPKSKNQSIPYIFYLLESYCYIDGESAILKSILNIINYALDSGWPTSNNSLTISPLNYFLILVDYRCMSHGNNEIIEIYKEIIPKLNHEIAPFVTLPTAKRIARAEQENINKVTEIHVFLKNLKSCLLYTSPSPRDRTRSRMPSSA